MFKGTTAGFGTEPIAWASNHDRFGRLRPTKGMRCTVPVAETDDGGHPPPMVMAARILQV